MPDFDPSKIVIVLIFLAILVAVQVVIKRSKFLKFKSISQIIQQLKLLIL